MNKIKKIMGFAAILIGFVTSADAQNWVLYQYVESKEIPNGHWFILEAFPSYELCKTEWDKQVSFPAANAKKVDKGEFLIKNEDGSTSWMSYKCLPDTIDPRK